MYILVWFRVAELPGTRPGPGPATPRRLSHVPPGTNVLGPPARRITGMTRHPDRTHVPARDKIRV
jgi:hypothetical protein